jgi:hypothetical protein
MCNDQRDTYFDRECRGPEAREQPDDQADAAGKP